MNDSGNYASQTSQEKDCPGNYEYTTDRFGTLNSALHFKGPESCTCTNEFSVSHIPSLGSYTVSLWMIKTSQNTQKFVMSLRASRDPIDYDYKIIFDLYDRQLIYEEFTSSFHTYDQSQLSQWTHIALVRTKDEGVLAYQNGKMVSQGVEYISNSFKPLIFTIGGIHNKCTQDTSIDDVRIYSRALSDEEIKELTKNRKIFLSTCSEVSKDTSEYVKYVFDSQNICAKNSCVESISSIQKTISIPNQASVDKILNLKDVLGYDTDCFDLYTKLSTDTVGPGDLNILSVNTIEGCGSPCNVDFTFSLEGTSHTFFRTTVPISFTRISSTELQNLRSTDSPTFYQSWPKHTISTSHLDINFGTFESRKQSDYSTPDSTDQIFESYVYYVFVTEQSGLNLSKSDISVKFMDPTYSDSRIVVNQSDFELQNGTAPDSYNLKIKGRVIGSHKIVIKQI